MRDAVYLAAGFGLLVIVSVALMGAAPDSLELWWRKREEARRG